MYNGYFGIGIYGSKTPSNVALLLRSAAINEAAFVFTVGKRYERHVADTGKFYNHLPVLNFTDAEDFFDHVPYCCPVVAVELCEGSKNLVEYKHRRNCIYLLGAEDHGLPEHVLKRCVETIQIPGKSCYNVAIAGSIVMYDRAAKQTIQEAKT